MTVIIVVIFYQIRFKEKFWLVPWKMFYIWTLLYPMDQ